jgi:nitric oxide reductase large subunit
MQTVLIDQVLFIGLMLWLGLVGRALWPALKRRDDSRSITMLLVLSTIAIGPGCGTVIECVTTPPQQTQSTYKR